MATKEEKASESILRNFRYEFFEEVLKKHQAHYLVLAHHQDDQLETILMKWSRGSTLEGLSGMKEIRQVKGMTILRPFLSLSKKELYQEAETHQVPYLEDESNESDNYTRNRYRHHVLSKGGKSKCRKSLPKECADDCGCRGLLNANSRKNRSCYSKRKKKFHSTVKHSSKNL